MTLDNTTPAGDNGISSSWEEILNEESESIPGVVVEEEKPRISPEENAERSRLGRRLSRQEQEISSMKDTLERLLSVMERKETSNAYEEEIDPDEPLTLRKQELLRRKEQENSEFYKRDYIRTIHGMMDTGGEMHDSIVEELLTNVSIYPTHTNHSNPIKDASINYRLAEANILKKKVGIKPNVRGESTKGAGLSTDVKSGSSTKKVQLDEYAQKAMKAWDLDDDFVQNSLNRKE